MNKTVPIACALTDRELQIRRKDHLDKAAASLTATRETPDGFIYCFALRDSILRELAEIIELERGCCPFLDFELSVRSDDAEVALKISAAEPQAKEIVRSLLGWNE